MTLTLITSIMCQNSSFWKIRFVKILSNMTSNTTTKPCFRYADIILITDFDHYLYTVHSGFYEKAIAYEKSVNKSLVYQTDTSTMYQCLNCAVTSQVCVCSSNSDDCSQHCLSFTLLLFVVVSILIVTAFYRLQFYTATEYCDCCQQHSFVPFVRSQQFIFSFNHFLQSRAAIDIAAFVYFCGVILSKARFM